MKAKVLAEQLLDLKAPVTCLEAKLGETRDIMANLELRVEDRKAMLVEKGEYIARLEEKLARATSNSLCLEG